MRDREAAHAHAAAHVARGDQHAAVRGSGGLQDGHARPLVLPEQRAVGRGDADRTFPIQQQDLRDAVDRRELWRAVAPTAGRALPARMAGSDVVRGEHAGGRNDDNVANNQRRARKSPARDFRVSVRRRVARPDDGAVTRVERVQNSGRTKRIDATIAHDRRPSRTGAAIRLKESGRVAACPHRLAGGQVVAGDDLVVTALLLRVDEVAADREGRPARSDRPTPQLDGRRCRPVGVDPHAANDAVL